MAARKHFFPISEGQGPLTMADGTALEAPSDDEMVPDLPQGTLPFRPPLGLVDSPSESAHECGGDWPTNNARTPRQSGGDWGAPSPQRPRTDSQGTRAAGDNEFIARRKLVVWDRAGAVWVNGEDSQLAILPHVADWLAYDILHGEGERSLRRAHHIFDGANSRDLPATHTFFRVAGTDPFWVALEFVGATMGSKREFRVMDAGRDSRRMS